MFPNEVMNEKRFSSLIVWCKKLSTDRRNKLILHTSRVTRMQLLREFCTRIWRKKHKNLADTQVASHKALSALC